MRGIVSHFEWTDARPPDWLWPWLEEQVSRGVRYIMLGEPGTLAVDENGRLGATRLRRWSRSYGLRIGTSENIEATATSVLAPHPVLDGEAATPRAVVRDVEVLDPARAVALVEVRPSNSPSERRHPVVLTEFGAVALDPWVIRNDASASHNAWRINPFELFATALDMQQFAVPEPRVLNGRRVFFCHVDGDGMMSRAPHAAGAPCGQVLRTEILDKFALPFTVSVVAGEVTDDLTDRSDTLALRTARAMLAPPNVEPASHGVAHPFYWHLARDEVADDVDYVALPSIRGFAYSPAAEVTEGLRFVNERLLAEGKHCRLFLWTGTALPRGGALDALVPHGALNLNGGVFRWDRQFPSYSHVSAMARVTPNGVHVLAGGPNERMFDGYFQGQPSVFRHAAESIRRTGGERILKPANVYIHTYSVEHWAGLEAVRALLREFGEESETAPVFASHYAAAVTSAMTTASVARTVDGWRVTGFGACRTVRIDDDARDVDLTRSVGVLGSHRRGRSLYVHLSQPEADIVLGIDVPAVPHVVVADHVLTHTERSESRLTLTSVSLARRNVTVGGLPTESGVRLGIDEEFETVRSDSTGRIHVRLPSGGPTRIELDITEAAMTR